MAKPLGARLRQQKPARATKESKAAHEFGDNFGTLCAAKKTFFEGLAVARDAFFPAAAEARSNSKLKRSQVASAYPGAHSLWSKRRTELAGLEDIADSFCKNGCKFLDCR
jgi:hypothetical protein